MTNPNRQKPDARALVAKFSKESASLLEREIIAPLLPGGKIRTRVGGLVYTFAPRGSFVGWGRFRPISEREAEPLAEAMPWQRAGYLEALPALRVVLLWPASETQQNRRGKPDMRGASVWWALPYNESDARQRFGLNGVEPVPVYLCDPTGGAERFERVIVRVDGRTLWFDGPDMVADPTHAEWLRDATMQSTESETLLPGLTGSERLALIYWQIHNLETAELPEIAREVARQGIPSSREQHERLRGHIAHNRLEDRLRRALAKADATLYSVSETLNPDGTPGTLVVEWSMAGQRHRYRSMVDPGANVVSSGICLSGRDRDFDLTSLVSVVTNRDR